jgi:hypothetical protein
MGELVLTLSLVSCDGWSQLAGAVLGAFWATMAYFYAVPSNLTPVAPNERLKYF